MNTAYCILDHFALFLYVRPGIKVKFPVCNNRKLMRYFRSSDLEPLIMIIKIEMIFLSVLYYHPFVSEKCSHLDCFVMTEFYTL